MPHAKYRRRPPLPPPLPPPLHQHFHHRYHRRHCQVFLAEYAGPILVFPLTLRHFGALDAASAAWPLYLWTFHFSKRVLETLFVHSFSKSSMPLVNLFKNCGYYWTAAFVVAWDVARMASATTAASASAMTYAFIGLFLLCEGLNGFCHLHLASLRSGSSKEKTGVSASETTMVPTAWPFQLVSSPNYSFEILSWVMYSLAFQSPVAGVFTLVGAAQMAVWSR